MFGGSRILACSIRPTSEHNSQVFREAEPRIPTKLRVQTAPISTSRIEGPGPLVGLRRSFVGILEIPNSVRSSQVLPSLPPVFQGFYGARRGTGGRQDGGTPRVAFPGPPIRHRASVLVMNEDPSEARLRPVQIPSTTNGPRAFPHPSPAPRYGESLTPLTRQRKLDLPATSFTGQGFQRSSASNRRASLGLRLCGC